MSSRRIPPAWRLKASLTSRRSWRSWRRRRAQLRLDRATRKLALLQALAEEQAQRCLILEADLHPFLVEGPLPLPPDNHPILTDQELQRELETREDPQVILGAETWLPDSPPPQPTPQPEEPMPPAEQQLLAMLPKGPQPSTPRT